MRQRRVFKEIDNPISEQEFYYVLDKACREDPVVFGHLLQLVGDVFESGRPDNGLTDAGPQP